MEENVKDVVTQKEGSFSRKRIVSELYDMESDLGITYRRISGIISSRDLFFQEMPEELKQLDDEYLEVAKELNHAYYNFIFGF